MNAKDQWKVVHRAAREYPSEIKFAVVACRPIYISTVGAYPVRSKMPSYYRRRMFRALDNVKASNLPKEELKAVRIYRDHAKQMGFKLP